MFVFKKHIKLPAEMPTTSTYFYQRFLTGPELGQHPPVHNPFGSRKAHARNTPPPGGKGQGAMGEGVAGGLAGLAGLAGWLGWPGLLAG